MRRYVPYVIEPSLGADRVALAFLCDAYDEEVVGMTERQGRCAHCSASASGSGSVQGRCTAAVQEADRQGYDRSGRSWLSSSLVDFDDAGSIGKRYRREDEIGTPFCVTVDFETEAGWLRNRS